LVASFVINGSEIVIIFVNLQEGGGGKNRMLQASPLKRYFAFLSVKLPDPNPKLTADEVRSFYSAQYPDLATASITGPEVMGDKLLYRFERAIGTKG
jgi:PRTRC genetic system protein C